MNKLVPIIAACTLLSACQPDAPPQPVAQYQPPPRHSASSKIHHARKKTPGGAPSEVATDCPWPAHARRSAATRLETASTQVPVPPGSAQEAVEGCAVLRFAVSKTGTVSWIDVVSAKPDTVAPVALKCLLAARFKAEPRPDKEALVRVDMQSPQPDLVVASLRVR